MADYEITVVDEQVVVRPFGSELLTPLISAAAAHAAAASGFADAAAASAASGGVATQAEVDAGVNAVKRVTPATLRAAKKAEADVLWIEYVSGPGNLMVWRPTSSKQLLTLPLSRYRCRGRMPFDVTTGSLAIKLTQYDGTSAGLPDYLPLRAPNGVDSLGVGSIRQHEVIDLVQNPDPVGTNPGVASLWRLEQNRDTALTTATKAFEQLLLQRHSLTYPLSVEKFEDRIWVVHNRFGVRRDDASRVRSADFVQTVMYDYARAQSQSGSVAAHVIGNNGDRAFIDGRWHEFSQFLANETAGGNWDREQPSVAESEPQIGLLTGTTAGDFKQLGVLKGYLKNTAADFSLFIDGGATNYAALTQGGIKNALTRIHFRTRSDACRGPNPASPTQAGEFIINHYFDQYGEGILTETRLGRLLTFDQGGTGGSGAFSGSGFATVVAGVPTAGATGTVVVGGTTGTQGVVASAPDLGATGTYAGGDRTGNLYIYNITGGSGDFAPGEDLLVGGIKRGRATAALGPALGELNWYGAFSNNTGGNFIKAAGQPQRTVGLQTGQMLGANLLIPAGQPPSATVAYGHTNDPSIQRVLHLPNGPRTPPEDFSLCSSTKMIGDDRVGGNTKVIVNASSSPEGMVVPIAVGGIYLSYYRLYYNEGVAP